MPQFVPSNSAVPKAYTFTEIINVNWDKAIDSDEETSPESQLWEKTLLAFQNHPGTTNIWWGQRTDAANILKLIIDWRSAEERDGFHASPAFGTLLQSWRTVSSSTTTDEPLFFGFNSDQRYRQAFFEPSDHCFPKLVHMFFTAHFPPTWDPDAMYDPKELRPQWQHSKKTKWIVNWEEFTRKALRSEGGWIRDKSLDAWPIGEQKCYISLFRFKDAELALRFLESVRDDLEKLAKVAEGEITVEVVNMLYASLSQPRHVYGTREQFSAGCQWFR